MQFFYIYSYHDQYSLWQKFENFEKPLRFEFLVFFPSFAFCCLVIELWMCAFPFFTALVLSRPPPSHIYTLQQSNDMQESVLLEYSKQFPSVRRVEVYADGGFRDLTKRRLKLPSESHFYPVYWAYLHTETMESKVGCICFFSLRNK